MTENNTHTFMTPNARFVVEIRGNDIVKLQVSGRDSFVVVTLDRFEVFDLAREMVRWCAMDLNNRFTKKKRGDDV